MAVSFEDVVQHALHNLEDAARQGNVKACKSLAQNVVREFVAGNASKSNRLVAIECGVVQSIVLVLKQFSVQGSERDHVARLHLVVTCLDILLDLGPFVSLEDNEVPVCILLRSFGVNVLVRSMVMHWGLRNRSLPLLDKSLRLLHNIGASEQGTRMLLECQVHRTLLDVLAKDRITERRTLLLILKVLVSLAVFQATSRQLFAEEPESGSMSQIDVLLRTAEVAGEDDYGFHRELTCLLCMTSTDSGGAKAILASEGSLGYIVKVLHSSSSAIGSTPESDSLRSDLETAKKLQQQLLEEDGMDPAHAAAVASGSTSKGDGGGGGGGGSPVPAASEPNSPISARSKSPVTSSTSAPGATADLMSMDSLNTTARNAVSAGSQLFNNLIRRPNASHSAQGALAKGRAAPQHLEEPDDPSSDAQSVACWASMLLHNLCVSAHEDVQMRMVIQQAYETSNAALGTRFDRPVFKRVQRSMEAVCTGVDNRGTSVPDQSSGRTIVDQIVNCIVHGHEAAPTPPKDDDFCGRAVLFGLDYIRTVHNTHFTLEEVLRALLERLTAMLLSDAATGLPVVLPISTQGSRAVSFVFMLLTHPGLKQRLEDEPGARQLIFGATDDLSFLSLLRSMDLPEYSGALIRCFQSLVNEEQGRLKVFPTLPYRSFQAPAQVGDGALGRHSSMQPSSPTSMHDEGPLPLERIDSGDRPTNPLRGVVLSGGSADTPSPPRDIQGGSRKSLQRGADKRSVSFSAGSPPSRFALKASMGVSVSGSSKKKRPSGTRRASAPYVPSHSNLILSPLLHGMSSGTQTVDGLDSGGEPGARDDQSDGSPKSKEAADSPSSSAVAEMDLLEWCESPEVVAVQMSLRMEQKYMVIDPARLTLLALRGELDDSTFTAEQPFLQEYDKCVYFFKRQVLAGPTPLARARIVQCIIDIAFHSATALLRNASLTMAGLEALSCSAIRRLELTWRNVSADRWQIFSELKKLCGLLEPPSSGTEPPGPLVGPDPTTFLAGARIPYLPGLLAALRHAKGKLQIPLDTDVGAIERSAGLQDSSAAPLPPPPPPPPPPPEQEQEQVSSGKSALLIDLDELQTDQETRRSRRADSAGSAPGELGAKEASGTGDSDFDPLGLFSYEAGGSRASSPPLSDLNQLETASAEPPRPPSPGGIAAALKPVDDKEAGAASVIAFEDVFGLYEVVAQWVATVRSNGDWFQRLYNHQPNVHVQILLRNLAPRPAWSEEAKMDHVSLRQEPPWSLDQMLLESLYAIEAWIESLFESETEEEGKVIRAFRLRIRTQEGQQASTDPLSPQGGQSGAGAVAGGSAGGAGTAAADPGTASGTGQGGSLLGNGGSGGASGSSRSLGGGGLVGDPRQTAARFRSFGETAAAQIFRSGAEGALSPGSSISGSSTPGDAGNDSILHSLPKVPAAATGKLINSLVRKISGARRERLVRESGSRSAEHWDRIVSHVRLCVERVVLAPVISRLLVVAMRDHIAKECALQERSLLLASASDDRLAEVLGLPTRGDLHKCAWTGAIATLRSFDEVDMPSLKLKVLLRLKDEIYREACKRNVADVNADEFLPVLTFVIVRAQLRHAYASTMLLRDLLSDDFVSGEAAYYFTTFEIALGHLLAMEVPADLVTSY